MKVAPCKDCNRRHVGCHSQCLDYKEWSEEHTKIMNALKLNNSLGLGALTESKRKNIIARIKKH